MIAGDVVMVGSAIPDRLVHDQDPPGAARHGIFPLVAGEWIIVAGGGIRAAHSMSSVVEVLDTRRARASAKQNDER